MKKTEGGKKGKEFPSMPLIEAASYNVPASEGIIRCENWIRLRSNKDMRRHTVDSFRFRISLNPVWWCLCIYAGMFFSAVCTNDSSITASAVGIFTAVLTGTLNTVCNTANNVSLLVHTVLRFFYNYRSSCSINLNFSFGWVFILVWLQSLCFWWTLWYWNIHTLSSRLSWCFLTWYNCRFLLYLLCSSAQTEIHLFL